MFSFVTVSSIRHSAQSRTLPPVKLYRIVARTWAFGQRSVTGGERAEDVTNADVLQLDAECWMLNAEC